MNDLLGFEILNGHYVSSGTPEKTAAASSWGDAVDKLWTVPKPRMIVSQFLKSTKNWEFRVVGGSQLKIQSRPDGDTELRHILRFAGDKGDYVVSAVGTTIADGSWVSAFPQPQMSFEAVIASGMDWPGRNYIGLLGHHVTGSLFFPKLRSRNCASFVITMKAYPSNSPARLSLGEHILPAARGATGIQSVGKCDISIFPWNHRHSWTETMDTIHVYRLDGDSLLMPNPADGWNLHAYGYMIQASGVGLTGSSKFLQCGHIHTPGEETEYAVSWVGCYSDTNNDRKRGFGGSRETEACIKKVFDSNPNSSLFGIHRGEVCWAQHTQGDKFVGDKRPNTECNLVSMKGLNSGAQGKIAVYQHIDPAS